MAEENQDRQQPGTESAPVSRREFLARGGTTLAVAAAAAGLAWYLHDKTGKAGLQQPAPRRLKDYFAGIAYPPDAPRLSIAHGGDDRIEQMVAAALGGLGGIERFIRTGDRVLIKPNVGFQRSPMLGATTNPEVLRFVVRACRTAGAGKIVVADNPIEDPTACFARSEIQKVAREEGADVLIPTRSHFEPVAIRLNEDGSRYTPRAERNEALGTWPVFWTPLADADKVIGVAPVKDHNLCSASLGMKNWYGLLGGRRNQFHQAIHDIISDLGLMMSPTLVINDGTRVLMKNGPTGGSLADVKAGHTLVASVDPIAADAYAYETLLGRDPANLTYLELAESKFGEASGRATTRFGQRDWKRYQSQGKLVEQNV